MCLYTPALPEYALIAALKRFKSISGEVRTLQCLSVAKRQLMKDQNDTRTIMLVLKNIMLSLIPQKTLVLIVVCPHNKGDKMIPKISMQNRSRE